MKVAGQIQTGIINGYREVKTTAISGYLKYLIPF